MTGPLMVDDYDLDLIIYGLEKYEQSTIQLLEATDNADLKRLLESEHAAIMDLYHRLSNQREDERRDALRGWSTRPIPEHGDPF